MQKKYRRFLTILTFILVISSTIAYSALTSTLQIDAEARLRTVSDIRVSGISLSSTNGGTLQYESSYDVNTITSGFVLPTTDSSITYKVTVTNNGTIDQTIYDILTQSSNNSGLYYEISGYNVRDVIGFKTVVEFYITYKTTTPSEEPINVVNKFNFKKVYHVTFEAKGGTSITDGIKYEGVDLSLSTFTSTKQGYILSGWTDEQDGTTVKYQTNGTYTLDRDLILYAVWEGNPNTSYSVNHYVHDLGTNTYTLDSTDNLTGTTDSTLTLASLKKTIPGFTYVDGYLTGGTTKPTSGAVTTTTILADGSRVINLYYRRNYLYIQYHVNGGSQHSDHGNGWGTSGSLVTLSDSTQFLKGVYGSKVGGVNQSTYVIYTGGLDNYHWDGGMHIVKNGYTAKWLQQWNTLSDGTGTSYDQDGENYDANGFGGADLTTGDKTVTLYVNWEPKYYSITYDLQGGSVVSANPTSYNIESNTITLNNPTLRGYTFLGWTGSNGTTPQTAVTIPTGSYGDKAYIANWQVNTYTVTADANGGSIPSTTGWTGTGNTATKSVTYNSPYGTLPEPTRTGYTFKGWVNGIESELILPSNYKQLDYIESTGTQYIDTGYIPKTTTKVELDLSFNGDFKNYNTYGGNGGFLGVIDNGARSFTINFGASSHESTILHSWFNKVFQYDGQGDEALIITDNIRTNRNKMTIENGRITYGTATRTISSKEYDQIDSMYIFGLHNNASVSSGYGQGAFTSYNMRVYDMKIYESDVLVRHYVPVIDKTTHKLGLYETVNGVFYSNETADEFETSYISSETVVNTSSNHTITAVWEAVNYEITYDLQGGSLATENPTTYNVETDTFTLNNPTLTGYTFTGWTGSNGNTPQTTVTIPTGSTGDKAYIANWQANTYNVIFDTDGGVIGANNLFSFDASTHTIDGTVVGATWGDDYLEFAGDNTTYVNLGQINSDYMTLQATFSIDEPATRSQVIMGSLEVGGASIHIESYSGEYVIAGQVRVGNSYRVISSDIVPEVGKKYNVLLSYDGKVEKLYINNVLIGTTEIEGVIKTPSSNTIMALGGNPYEDRVTKEYFKGKIYNASIYSNPKKQVTYNSPYGTLPTPTRDGYIFKGWNGKNVFKETNLVTSTKWQANQSVTVTKTEDSVRVIYNQTTSTPGYIYNYRNDFLKIGKTYTVSTLVKGIGEQNKRFVVNVYGNNVITTNDLPVDDYHLMSGTFTYVGETQNFILLYGMNTSIGSGFEVKYLQIEEGTTATPYEPYYVTNTVNVTQSKDHTLKAIWEKKEATFLPGSEFNAKIKQLAGNENATYQTSDTNITSIVRSNSLDIMPVDENVVSTSDSNTPIYAWFNNGTLYYYSESQELYMNSYAYAMFRNLTKAVSIDLSGISTKLTTEMSAMFLYDDKLATLDLSNFDTSKVRQMQSMFHSCASLQELDLSSFDLTSITNSGTMFNGMTALKRLKTPEVIPSGKTVVLSKLLVDASGNEYTELNSSSPTNTMLYTPATFLPGQEFNIKIKQLAGNSSPTTATADTNITNIVRTNTLSITPTNDNIVSTSDSNTPIYAWFDNGIIYYYSEAADLYLNSNANYMFMNLRGLTSLDIDTINTNKTTQMVYTFYNLVSLQSLNLSNFDTSNVSLMQGLFYGCNSLTSLDISTFDMDSVTNTNSMIGSMAFLESLKTPKVYPSEAVIQMPKTLYDSSGNSWSVLDSSAPTETWLHKMVCKRATTLHTETCNQTNDSLYCSGAGYTVGGSKNTRTITYGSLGTNASTLNSGDAFTCDVNGDGTFNETNERFYYVGDYYNTTTKEFETDTGVLIYYNNVSGGTPNNTATSRYYYPEENWHGPVTAITQLPTTSQWTNISLKNNTRAILNNSNNNTTTGGTLPSDFSYSGYSARLLTMQEINNATGETGIYKRLDVIAPYLFENTKYSIDSLNNRWWIETANSNDISCDTLYVSVNESSGYTNGIYGDSVLGLHGVRPAIEVNKNFLNKKVNAYLITYDTNGGSENTTQTVTVGDSLGTLSVPTKEGYTFNGWYTAASGGEEVTTATVPTATTTYYAHWTANSYTVTADANGGSIPSTTGWTGTGNTATKQVIYDSAYGTLPELTRTGYTFDGWYKPSYNNYQFNSSSFNSHTTLRTSHLSHWSWQSEQYRVGDILEFDITIEGASILGAEINDVNIGSSNYEINGNNIKGKVIITNAMLGVHGTAYYSFLDIACDDEITSYTINKYTLTQFNNDDIVTSSTTVNLADNHTLYAHFTAHSYTVTADANGGSIPSTSGWTGIGATATKSVTYDSPYGTLPTPTRDGYIFKGWNGKNLLNTYNTSSYTKNGVTGSVTNNGLINISGTTTSSTNYGILAFNWYGLPELEIGKQYTFSISKDLQGLYVQVNYKNTSGREAALISKTTKDKFTFTPPNNYSYLNSYFIGVVKNSENIDETFTVQIEEGTVATAHEPYYVTSSTNVTQDKNHTLKAIWEMDTYEIQYDLQGGSLANSNPATYNVETNTFTLNNPTLTGQTFIGWTGSNGNTPEVNVTIPVGSYGDKAYVAHFSPIYEPETRIRSLNTIGTSIADDDPDSNFRYIGSNPNNYVSFNGQKWRIIGVFNGKLKIIQDSIGNYSFDTSRNTVNNGNGVNQWGPSGTYTGADLMKLLNPGYSSNTDLKCNTTITYTDGIYNCGDNTDSNYTSGLVNNSLWWNAESGYCYNNGNYSTTACDFTTTGLQSNTARNMIDNATWYLGSNLGSENVWDGRLTASYLYNIERSNNTGKQCSSGNYCSDDVTRTTTWQGKVGLLYPSDYVYATSGGTTHNRNTCLTVHAGYVADDSNIQNWNNTYTDCKNNDWLFNVSTRSWTISPSAFGNYSTGVFVLNYGGYIYRLAAVPAIPVRPVVYLKSSIKFTTGDGSYNSPFNLIDTE